MNNNNYYYYYYYSRTTQFCKLLEINTKCQNRRRTMLMSPRQIGKPLPLCRRLLPDGVATAIWTRALLRLSPARQPLAFCPTNTSLTYPRTMPVESQIGNDAHGAPCRLPHPWIKNPLSSLVSGLVISNYSNVPLNVLPRAAIFASLSNTDNFLCIPLKW